MRLPEEWAGETLKVMELISILHACSIRHIRFTSRTEIRRVGNKGHE